jgi:choline dehydrogenase-like flavoprotein
VERPQRQYGAGCGWRDVAPCTGVCMASKNFQDAPVIDGNYLGTDQDFAAIVRAIEAARELGNQRAFDSVREVEVMPGPKAAPDEIRELARLGSASFGHAVGTCRMGVDDFAVVDPELRVHGLTGLRVADGHAADHCRTHECADSYDRGPRPQLILG